jgi:hypothetical protein
MDEFVLMSLRSGDHLTFRSEPWVDAIHGYEGPPLEIGLVSHGLTAHAIYPAYSAEVERLVVLMREVDENWRGWEGEKRIGEPDRDRLAFAARHDGQGHILLTVFLFEEWSSPSLWSVRADLLLDVGSARDIAERLNEWQNSIWPTDRRWRTAGDRHVTFSDAG